MYETKSIALVTGASSGIGRAVAAALLNQNRIVIGTSRHIENLVQIPEFQISNFCALYLDVTNDISVESLFQRLPGHLHEIDILINCAGSDLGGRRDFHTGSMQNWISTIDANVNGVMRVTHVILPAMIRRNFGDIINIGSLSGLLPAQQIAAYSASKHAIDGFTESLSLELDHTSIRVMQVLPGRVRTNFAANRLGSDAQGDQYYEDVDRWLLPEDVASAVLYMLQQPRHVVIPRLVITPRPPKPESPIHTD